MKIMPVMLMFLVTIMTPILVEGAMLPRHVGKIHLNMTANEFKMLTGVVPGSCPTECSDSEEYADLTGRKLKHVDVTGADSIEVNFWNNRVYYISLINKKKEKASIMISELKKKYGAYQEYSEGAPNVRVIVWNDRLTELSLVYDTVNDIVVRYSYKDLKERKGAGW
jgi:hypothetical protein